MTSYKTQYVEQIITLTHVVDAIKLTSINSLFLDTNKMRSSIVSEDFKAVYDYVLTLKAWFDESEAKADLVQIFEKIERDLLKIMICVEHDKQASLKAVVISAYNRVGEYTDDFEKAANSFNYPKKAEQLKVIVNTIEKNSFIGSDMVVTIIGLMIESNERVAKLNELIAKQG